MDEKYTTLKAKGLNYLPGVRKVVTKMHAEDFVNKTISKCSCIKCFIIKVTSAVHGVY